MIGKTQNVRSGQSIRAARVVPATAAQAYAACTDAATMGTWWGHTGNATLFLAEADVKVGGHFRYGMRSATGREELASGTFWEIFPGHRLVFGWSVTDVEGVAHESVVSIDFLDLKDGTTRVVVTHHGLPAGEAPRYSAGWHDMIQDLGRHFVSQ